MKYTKLNNNTYRLDDSLTDKVNEFEDFMENFIVVDNEVISTNPTMSLIILRLVIAKYVVNDFLNIHKKVLTEEKMISINIEFNGRIYTLSLGMYNGELLYNIEA